MKLKTKNHCDLIHCYNSAKTKNDKFRKTTSLILAQVVETINIYRELYGTFDRQRYRMKSANAYLNAMRDIFNTYFRAFISEDKYYQTPIPILSKEIVRELIPKLELLLLPTMKKYLIKKKDRHIKKMQKKLSKFIKKEVSKDDIASILRQQIQNQVENEIYVNDVIDCCMRKLKSGGETV